MKAKYRKFFITSHIHIFSHNKKKIKLYYQLKHQYSAYNKKTANHKFLNFEGKRGEGGGERRGGREGKREEERGRGRVERGEEGGEERGEKREGGKG